MGLLQTDLVESALRKPWVIKFLALTVPPLDKFLLKISRGWLNTAMQTIVLMETTGAKTGVRRETVTLCMPHGNNVVLVGSNWGQERHPAWVFNLRKQPEAHIRFRGYVGPVCARELDGEERSEMWLQLIQHNPQYQRYADQMERTMPVILLEKI